MDRSKHKGAVVIVTHKFVTHPDDELVTYLNERKQEHLLHICHSFSDALDRKSYFTWYKKGKVYKQKFSADYRLLPLPLLYLKEMYFTLLWIVTSGIKWDIYIGMDGLCVLFGNILKTVGKVSKTIYWAIDFVPANRFRSSIANKIYHSINTHGYKNSDEMWDLSPRMAEAREHYLHIKASDYKKIRVVQYGMWVDRIKKYSYTECEKSTLVFMGHLKENQGVQLVLKALPKIIKKNPNFRFKVIGTGPYLEELKKMAKQLKVDTHCDFKGKIADHREVEAEIAKSCLAIAPYMKKLDKWTYYADPGKVKTYLACGVPVLLTDLPWNTREIVVNKCGFVITEDITQMSDKIIEMMKPEINNEYRRNAVKYARNFNYSTIFASLDV